MTTAATPAEIVARNNAIHDAVSQLGYALRRLFARESDALYASLAQGPGWNGSMPMNTARACAQLDVAEGAITGWQKRCPAVAKASNAVALLSQLRAARRVLTGSEVSLASVGIEARV